MLELRTSKRIVNVFFWKHVRKDVEDFVQRFEVCQRNKYQALKSAGLLQPIALPMLIWEELTRDFIGELLWKGHNPDGCGG